MAEYARMRDVAPYAISQQVMTGVIKLVDGKVDVEQADASWGVARRASRGIIKQDTDAGRRSAKAKVAVTLAKLRLLKQRFEDLSDRYVDRAEAVAQGETEAAYVLEGLRSAPAAYGATLASEMGIAPDAAVRILERFVAAVVVEIGDLPRQARRDAERA